MNSAELKSGLHNLIDQVNDENLLQELYTEIKNIVQVSSSGIWETLTEDQKKEIMLSIQESEDDNNLLSSEEVLSRYQKWITK